MSCLFCSVRPMRLWRKRSRPSHPSMSLHPHPHPHPIQSPPRCCVGSVRICWLMLWWFPAAAPAPVMNVSICSNISQKQTGCFWQSFGVRYQNMFAGVWRTPLSNLQTVRCFSWCFDREHCFASSKTLSPVSSCSSSSASSFRTISWFFLTQEVNHFRNGTRSLRPNHSRRSRSPIPESSSKRRRDVREKHSHSTSPLNRNTDQKRPRHWKKDFQSCIGETLWSISYKLPTNKHEASKCIFIFYIYFSYF